MPVKRITSRDNPTYRELLALATDGRTRRRQRQTLLDGLHLLSAAVEAGHAPRMLVVSEAGASPEGGLAHDANVPCIELPDSLFRALSPVDTPTGILALLDIPAPREGQDEWVVLLEDIQDPGNLGALLRVAAGAGVNAVHLSRGCAEAWSPKCLRGGQGAHFLLSLFEDADLLALARRRTVLAAALNAQTSLFELDLRGPAAFAFGNEGSGLSPALLEAARPFRIPMPGRVESLNVATAAAVCLFERVRQTLG
ncbi:MAG: RNA methyltransferase [Betaproteobacteria bacterium]|nr:RNA methyltransferase [Betaproteobacteria bacterium]